jgi:hypothetical protein
MASLQNRWFREGGCGEIYLKCQGFGFFGHYGKKQSHRFVRSLCADIQRQHVRLGSFSDLDTPKHEVRFAAKSGHRPTAVALMVALAVG